MWPPATPGRWAEEEEEGEEGEEGEEAEEAEEAGGAGTSLACRCREACLSRCSFLLRLGPRRRRRRSRGRKVAPEM